MVSRGKKLESLKRKKQKYITRETVLIVCEGQKSEPHYFHSLKRELKLHDNEVEVCGKECGSAPISVVEFAKVKEKIRENKSEHSDQLSKYDKIWCVMDVEAPTPHESLDQAIELAVTYGYKVVLSNPCFEYWYLIHFKKTARLMQSNAEVVSLLKDYLTDYSKSDKKVFSKIYPKTDLAIKNITEIIVEKCYSEDLKDSNPSTHVHKLVKYLREIASMQPVINKK